MTEEQKNIEEQPNNKNKSEEQVDSSIILSVLAYIYALVIIPVVFLLNQNKNERSEFLVFHTNQGFILFIFYLIAHFLAKTIVFIPFAFIIWLFVIVLSVIGIVNVVTNKKKHLPLVGKLFTLIK